MGYNTWNCFGGEINETLIQTTADLMVDLGLAKAGYKYLVVDDAWSNPQRGPKSDLQANSQRFPSGMAKLAEHIHSKGLKFGMYSDAGGLTCMGYPGSRGHEEQDAESFASWGVDYLKYDNCFAPASDWVVDRYMAMRDALNKTGRPILYSLCDWGVGDPWLWAPKVGNSWRTTGDIANNWDAMLRCLDNTVGLSRFAGPGGWNDPDMLEVGNGQLTYNEERAHFALWALLKSPLLIGADLRTLSKSALSVLTAAEVIAANQDPLGVAGDLIWKEGPIEVYAGPLQGGDRAVVLFNRHVDGTQYPHSNITGRQAQAMAQAQAEITSTESLELVRCLLRVSINQVAYMRGPFGDKSFKCVDMHGMQLQMLLPKDAETKRLVDWIELGVTDALKQKYLKTLYFGISTDPEGTSLLEEYIFSFKYDADGHVTLDINHGKDETFTTASQKANHSSVKYQVCRLMHVLVQICQTLDNVPTERYIFMRLACNESTPEEYEPPYFKSHEQQNAPHFVRKPFSKHVGDVLTNHHAVSLNVKSVLDACDGEAMDRTPKKRKDTMVLMTEPQDDVEIECDNGDEDGTGADDAQIHALKSWCFNFSSQSKKDLAK
ncbi:hypothetical protein WJX72_012363 [[Myrmecia] bisecta]|uniref:Alpha-galactosidase n=1 Tax=[Myrmecia] bisecta TaxID=41462 RepID=A0AAW1PQ17_9CHLO